MEVSTTGTIRTTAITRARFSTLEAWDAYALSEPLFFELFALAIEAHQTCRKGKMKSNVVLRFNHRQFKRLSNLVARLYAQEYSLLPIRVFIVYFPLMREIQASRYPDRVVQHIYYNELYPLVEQVAYPRNYACRKGMGALKAVKQLVADIQAFPDKDNCYIFKLDLKGFFMSIDKRIVYDLFIDLIQTHYPNCAMKNTLLYLTRIIYLSSPVDTAERVAPLSEWVGLSPSKSIFGREWWQGLIIGNTTTQLAAILFTSVILWHIHNELNLNPLNYTDDNFNIGTKEDFLVKIPYIRAMLANDYHLTLHPHKFYCQHWTKGVKALGYTIRRGEIFVGQRIRRISLEKVRLYLSWAEKDPTIINERAERFVNVINSYFGSFKHAHSYKLRKEIVDRIQSSLWCKAISFDEDCNKAILAKELKKSYIAKIETKRINYRTNKYQLKINLLCTQKLKMAC